MVFYLCHQRSRRIIVNPYFFTFYIHMHSLKKFILENHRVILFETTMAHLYTYIDTNIMICNNYLFSRWCPFSANVFLLPVNILHSFLFFNYQYFCWIVIIHLSVMSDPPDKSTSKYNQPFSRNLLTPGTNKILSSI